MGNSLSGCHPINKPKYRCDWPVSCTRTCSVCSFVEPLRPRCPTVVPRDSPLSGETVGGSDLCAGESQPDQRVLNIRVADIGRVYREWSSKGAVFLMEPKDHGTEIRAYVRDPDGHLIEVVESNVLLGPIGRERTRADSSADAGQRSKIVW
jgi:hypothetical protein